MQCFFVAGWPIATGCNTLEVNFVFSVGVLSRFLLLWHDSKPFFYLGLELLNLLG